MNILRGTLFVLLSALLPLSSSQKFFWNYGDQRWNFEGATCTGESQSPIALCVSNAVKNAEKTNVQFKWDRTQEFMQTYIICTNNTLAFGSWDFTETTVLDGITYKVSVLKYHWGSDASKGSEHSVEGEFYSGELEFFHYKTGVSLAKAQALDDGVIIVSVFLKEDPKKKEDIDEWKDFMSAFPKVQESNKFLAMNFTDTKLSLSRMIPSDRQFFRYTGSASTPRCKKPVERIVFKTPMEVSSKFLAALRTFTFPDGTPMQDNFRNIQDTSGRAVYKSFD